jgi:hypothetical protein
LNNKFKDKKEIEMNRVLAQLGGTGNKSDNKRGHREANKFGSIIYHCFICNFIENKIYECLHKDAICSRKRWW